jgi:hypothetical protein
MMVNLNEPEPAAITDHREYRFMNEKTASKNNQLVLSALGE